MEVLWIASLETKSIIVPTLHIRGCTLPGATLVKWQQGSTPPLNLNISANIADKGICSREKINAFLVQRGNGPQVLDYVNLAILESTRRRKLTYVSRAKPVLMQDLVNRPIALHAQRDNFNLEKKRRVVSAVDRMRYRRQGR